MPTRAMFTATERMQLLNALCSSPIDGAGKRLIDKVDGQMNPGTIGVSSTYLGNNRLVDEMGADSHLTHIVLSSLPVTMTDGTTNGSIGNQLLYTFPAGMIHIRGARTNLTLSAASGIGASGTVKHSLGTAAVSGDDTLDLTEANIIPSTSTTLSSSAGTAKGKGTATAITALTDNTAGAANNTLQALADGTTYATDVAAIRNNFADLAAKVNELIARLTLCGNALVGTFDGTSSAITVYLNFGVPDASSSANSTLTVSGDIWLEWSWQGN